MDEQDTTAEQAPAGPETAPTPTPLPPSPGVAGRARWGKGMRARLWSILTPLALLAILATGLAFRLPQTRIVSPGELQTLQGQRALTLTLSEGEKGRLLAFYPWDEGLALHPDERFLTMVALAISTPEQCRSFLPHLGGGETTPLPGDLNACFKAYLDTNSSPLNPRNHSGYEFWVYGSLPMTLFRITIESLNITGFTQVTIMGRLLTLLADLTTIVVTFFLGRRLWGTRTGLLAALFLALSVLNIQNAHFFTVDIATALMTLLCVYLAVVVAEGKGNYGTFILLGLAFGTAVACKVNVAVFAAIIVLAGGVRLWRALQEKGNRPLQKKFLVAVLVSALATALAMVLLLAVKKSSTPRDLVLLALVLTVVVAVGCICWWLATYRPTPGGKRVLGPLLRDTFLGLVIVAFLSLAVFRFAQPDAFKGPQLLDIKGALDAAATQPLDPNGPGLLERVGQAVLDQRYLANMNTIQGLVSGEVDYYPSHQWTGRPALWFPWENMVLWGLGLPLGLAAWAGVGLAGWQLFRKRDLRFIVPLAWTVFFFIYEGVQFVKTMRYFLPLYPLLCIFAAYLLVWLWDWARAREARPHWRTYGAGALLGLAIVGTLLWAWGFVQIYRRPITRATASRWVFHNLTTDQGAWLTLSDGTHVPIAVPNAQVYTPGAVTETPFALSTAGTATQLTLAHLQDLTATPGQELLQVMLCADQFCGEILAQGEVRGDFSGAAGDSAPGVAALPPTALEAGRSYYLRIMGRQGTVCSWAVALANEQWDDAVPYSLDGNTAFGPPTGCTGSYRGLMMAPYGEDTPEKVEELLHQLANTDYVLLTSNRLYDSIPRLPMRYPATTRYYRALFDGSLGFERVATFTSYPSLFSLGVPQGLADTSDEERAKSVRGWLGLPVPDQGAEEAFSVYDHPKVQIFRRTAAFDIERARALLTQGIDWESIARIRPIEVPGYYWRQFLQRLGLGGFAGSNLPEESRAPSLMLTEQESEVQRQGGTWSEIFNPDGWTNHLALPVWLLLVELLGLACLPLAHFLLGRLADGGYLPAKALGLLLLGYLSWLLVASKLLPYTRWTIALVLGVLIVLGGVVGWFRRAELKALFRERYRLILLEEGLFLAAFLLFLLIRLGNPDLWHPWFGGEKPMDLAYLNAVIRSTTFPPYDPWFSGGYLNYYYFSYILVATPIKLTGIVPGVAYNLALPLLYGLTCGGAFTVVYHLVHRKWGEGDGWNRRAILCGLAGAAFVALLGNLGQFYFILTKLGEASGLNFTSNIPGLEAVVKAVAGIPRALREGLPGGLYSWYWKASRVIAELVAHPAGYASGNEINEFPFFTFLYADLHAHMVALPFTLLALTQVVALVQGHGRKDLASESPQPVTGHPELLRDFRHTLRSLVPPPWLLVGLLLVLGALRCANSWDFPTYFLVAVIAWGVALYERHRRLDWRMAASVVLLAVVLWVFSTLLFQPFWSRYGEYYNSLTPWTGERTWVGEFILINGLSLFILGSYLVSEAFGKGARERPLHLLSLGVRYWDHLPTLVRRLRRWDRTRGKGGATAGVEGPPAQPQSSCLPALPILLWGGVAVLLIALFFFLPVTAGTETAQAQPSLLQHLREQHLLGWLILLAGLGAILFLRRRATAEDRLLSLFALAGLGIAGLVELYVLKGDIGRQNTSFKFYLQIWVLWAIVSAAVLPRLWRRTATWAKGGRILWRAAFFILVGMGLLYPLTATPAKMQDRFPDNRQGPGLDGEAFMQTEVYQDEHGPIVLAEDAGAIRWLEENVKGSPVTLEGVTCYGRFQCQLYRWGSRISIHTGLPTVIGWDWHQRQQRAAVEGDVVEQRVEDVVSIYSSPDIGVALNLIRKYRISYIVVGQLERYYYSAEGLAKFERMVGTYLERVYPGALPQPKQEATAAPAPTPTVPPYPRPATSSTSYPGPAQSEQPAAGVPTPSGGTIIYHVLPAVWEQGQQ